MGKPRFPCSKSAKRSSLTWFPKSLPPQFITTNILVITIDLHGFDGGLCNSLVIITNILAITIDMALLLTF